MTRPELLLAILLFLGATAFFTHTTATLILADPPVWPDESLFAQPALDLLREGTMGTDLLSGFLPGIEERTYWMPPVSFLVTAAVFGLAGPGVAPLRAISACAALAVILLTCALVLRAGLGLPAALTAGAAVSFDSVVLRAARIGRMDMLGLALILAALVIATPSPRGVRSRNAAASGVVSGLAALTHPVGCVALLAIAAGYLLSPPAARRRALLPFVLGFLAVAAPWILYVLQDPHAFWGQASLQALRKTSRGPLTLAAIGDSFRMNLLQYGRARSAAHLLWILGAVGIVASFRTNRPARFPALAAALIAAAVLAAREMWYPVYFAPFAAAGAVAVPVILARRRGRAGRAAVSIIAIASLGWFANENMIQQRRIHRRSEAVRAASGTYGEFCDRISAALPGGAHVLLAVIPDPYLGLLERRDLTIRSFPPGGMPLAPHSWAGVLGTGDFIILGRTRLSEEADRLAHARGEVVAEIGRAEGVGYYAAVYRIGNPD